MPYSLCTIPRGHRAVSEMRRILQLLQDEAADRLHCHGLRYYRQ